MHPWLLVLLPLHVLASKNRPHGVSPELASRYTPTKKGSVELWQCLDGSKSIEWSAVNDDFCDCADGSDEPGTSGVHCWKRVVSFGHAGTSACPNSQFYCVNEGHIGSYLPSTRVNDGLCGASHYATLRSIL